MTKGRSSTSVGSGTVRVMHPESKVNELSTAQLRERVNELHAQVSERDSAIEQYHKDIERYDDRIKQYDDTIKRYDQTVKHYRIREQQLIHEIALLKRHRYGRRSEGLDSGQLSLLKEQIDEDLAALETELEKLSASHSKPATPIQKARRQPLPPPTTSHSHPSRAQLDDLCLWLPDATIWRRCQRETRLCPRELQCRTTYPG
ncbi:MAG: transposase [Parasphingorhabdus sp.]|jgi:transposase